VDIRRAVCLIALAASAPGQVAPVPGAGIQRTMTLLASSTPLGRNAVKILFYGQSITLQDWWKQVAGDLRRRYPYADLTIANRALGGFSSPILRRPLPHDLLPFYPDLVIFHDYGGEPEYEEIIRWIRSNTTAEIAVQTDHVTWLPPADGQASEKDLKTYQWHEKHCSEWLPALAGKYGLEVIDVRTAWKKHLAENRPEPKDLLRDGVHLNARGDELMARIVSGALRESPGLPPQAGPVTTLAVGKDVAWQDGRLTLEFDGNRVDLLASRSARQPWSRASVRIDGKRPSEFPELYAFTRPSDSIAVDWPCLLRVGSQAPLQVEDWFLTITSTDAENKVVGFAVQGSRTGPDGSGTSAERFVSRSGRVIIEPGDWHLQRAYDLRKVLTPVGYVCRWQAVPLFADVYEPPLVDDRTREYAVTVAQGLAPGRHKLEVISESPAPPQLEAIRVFRPPLR
jgi:hypothetical protein